jgi:hypothetical protein
MIACACSIWHIRAEHDRISGRVPGAFACYCECHDDALDSDTLADLAIIGARVRDGGYADDTAPYAPFGVDIPWRVAIEL